MVVPNGGKMSGLNATINISDFGNRCIEYSLDYNQQLETLATIGWLLVILSLLYIIYSHRKERDKSGNKS